MCETHLAEMPIPERCLAEEHTKEKHCECAA